MRHSFSYVLTGIAVSAALLVGLTDLWMHPHFFSGNSLQELSVLNQKYEMSVTDIALGSGSPVISELIQTNVLLTDKVSPLGTLGLLATLEDRESILLIQPSEALSTEELETAAQDYQRAIPEFKTVEVDQAVSLESPLFGWTEAAFSPPSSTAVVQLSSEMHPIKVAVIDSGVDRAHEVFKKTLVENGWNTLTDDTTMYDDVGHGTHIAGIIAKMAPQAEIIPYKVVNAKGGKLSNVLEAFSRALEDSVDVINTSFGVSSPSYALESMVNEAYEQGVIVVSAAGNNSSDTGFYPAHYAQTVAVGSADAAGKTLSTSNYGIWVDVAANGYRVRSALPNNQYGYKTGTSQATAFVSAAVARLLFVSPDLTLEEVLTKLESSPHRILEGSLAGTPIVQ